MALNIENVREKTEEIHISYFSNVEGRSPAEGPGSSGGGGVSGSVSGARLLLSKCVLNECRIRGFFVLFCFKWNKHCWSIAGK